MQSKTQPADSEVAASLAHLAHEINNPLAAVLNLLFLVRGEATLTVKGYQYLALAQEEIQRLAQIANGALHHYRDPAALKETDVPRLLDSVIELYSARLRADSISVQTRYRIDSEAAVYASELRQVFSNLLLNAADSMPGGGRLQARASEGHEWSGQGRAGLRLTFADTGCGISKENLRDIFEPFFSTKGAGGCGLGLALVRGVVRKHGGSLRVRSSTKPGRSGSVFSIFLPVGQRVGRSAKVA